MSDNGLAAKVRGLEERVDALECVFMPSGVAPSGGDVYRAQQAAKAAARADKIAARKAARVAGDAGAAAIADEEAKVAKKVADAKVEKIAADKAAKREAKDAQKADYEASKEGKAHVGLLAALVLFVGVGLSILNARTLVDWTTGLSNGGTATVTTDDAGTATLTTDAATITTVTATDATVSDDLTVTDDAQVGGILRVTKTATTVTNNQTITIADGVIELDGIGSPDNNTNTVVLANVASTAIGGYCLLYVEAASSNLVTIADSAPAYLAGAWTAQDNNDSLLLYIVDTNVFVEVSRSDN